jgi:pyruvate formate lyase activating enzyme
MTAGEIFAEICKDAHYYSASGGGATFSGGECLLYPRFLSELLKICRYEKIHTAIETALYVPWENIEHIIPFTDAFLADIKHMDKETHKKYTGKNNALILENLKKLSENHTDITVRAPVIPHVNDSRENLFTAAEFIYNLKNIKNLELLKYNPLAKSKYERLGERFENFSPDTQTDGEMDSICEDINRFLQAENFAVWK